MELVSRKQFFGRRFSLARIWSLGTPKVEEPESHSSSYTIRSTLQSACSVTISRPASLGLIFPVRKNLVDLFRTFDFHLSVDDMAGAGRPDRSLGQQGTRLNTNALNGLIVAV